MARRLGHTPWPLVWRLVQRYGRLARRRLLRSMRRLRRPRIQHFSRPKLRRPRRPCMQLICRPKLPRSKRTSSGGGW